MWLNDLVESFGDRTPRPTGHGRASRLFSLSAVTTVSVAFCTGTETEPAQLRRTISVSSKEANGHTAGIPWVRSLPLRLYCDAALPVYITVWGPITSLSPHVKTSIRVMSSRP
jgi:hypothetical protein